jgi:transcriptional regulator with XRE-family HTH domain
MINKKCGERVLEYRKKCHLTQAALAKLIFRSVQNISQIENGHLPLSLENAHRLGKILNVRPQYLLCEDNFASKAGIYERHREQSRVENCISDAITENNYLAMAICGDEVLLEGNEIAEIEDYMDCEDILKPLYNIDRYIIATPTDNYVECSEKEYKELIAEIFDYIGFRLKHFTNSCKAASDEDIRKFEYNFSDERIIDEVFGGKENFEKSVEELRERMGAAQPPPQETTDADTAQQEAIDTPPPKKKRPPRKGE